jgi:ribosomal protein S27E
MDIRCIFGHDSRKAIWNAGLTFGRCDRCGENLVRATGGRWYAMPKRYTVRRKAGGRHVIPPAKLLRMCREEAPFLHRFRRRRGDTYGGYFD